MCVILEKIAGKEVPYEHLLASAHRNPDGYGVAVQDRGQLEVIQGLGKPEESAAAVAKFLEQAKDLPAFAHFRYRTMGDVSAANTHPITILKKQDDGIDLQFMHNGTISGFPSDAKSDSLLFAERIILPLAKRSVQYLGAEEVTADPLLATILQKYAEGVSKFVLFDGNGNSLVINRKGGVEQPYGWASNAYSLHKDNIPTVKPQKTVVYSSDWPRQRKPTDHEDLVNLLNDQRRAKPNSTTCSPTVRMTTEEITGHNLKSFLCLDQEQVRQMVDDEPDLSAILILDLLHALYNEDFNKTLGQAA